MARYYCEYCHSYLTHDTLSVRKSHLVGKNHLRITADYYRNKARDEKKRMFKQKHTHKIPPISKDPSSTKKIPLHCPTNKEKKVSATLSRAHNKELDLQHIDTLSKLYDGSPGYSKVFIDANRLDIGDLVKANKLPQRANAATQLAQQLRTRDETSHHTRTTTEFTLEPPRILALWATTVPKTRIYNDNGASLTRTIDESKKLLPKRRKH